MKNLLRNKIFWFLGLSFIVILFGFSWHKPSSSNDGEGPMGVVVRGDLLQRTTISGQIWPHKRLDIRPPYEGYIAKLYVKVGDHVKTGDPIVTFSPSLSAGETNFPIRAGFAGTVTQVWKSEGEYVLNTGDQTLVVRVEDLSELSVLATVPELDIAKLKVGQEALVKVSSLVGETFKAKINEIGLSAKDKDRYSSASTEFQIKAALESHDERLYPGMSTVMDVITDRREKVLSLAHEYLQQDDEGYFVTTEDGAKKRVKIGLQTDESAEVLSGLNEGDHVRPIDFLHLPPLKD